MTFIGQHGHERGEEIVIGASVTGVTNLGRNREMEMSMNSRGHDTEKRFHYHRHFSLHSFFSLPCFFTSCIIFLYIDSNNKGTHTNTDTLYSTKLL